MRAARPAASAAGVDPQVGRWLRLLRAEVELEAGEPVRATQALGPAGPRLPERPELLLRARATLDAARTTPAPAGAGPVRELAGQLQTWVADHRADALAWEQLALAHEMLGNRLAGARARAEVRAALGDLGAAVDLLRAARRSSQAATGADFIEASVIDARLRELETQRRQIAQELRAGRQGRGPEDPDRVDDARR
jgi:predicted Zn-dependent protease